MSESASTHVPLAEERSRHIHHHIEEKGQIRKTGKACSFCRYLFTYIKMSKFSRVLLMPRAEDTKRSERICELDVPNTSRNKGSLKRVK